MSDEQTPEQAASFVAFTAGVLITGVQQYCELTKTPYDQEKLLDMSIAALKNMNDDVAELTEKWRGNILDEEAADREAAKNQALHRERDDLAGDLLEMFNDCHLLPLDETHDLLMQKLSSYCVRRDHRVYDHAYRLGAENGKKKD